MSWAGFRMRWRGCIKRLNANEGRFCTTIGLPFSSLRGTIIKSNSVSTTNAGNKETWQQKNVKRQHGAQHRAKNAQNSGFRRGLAPCSQAFCWWCWPLWREIRHGRPLHDVLFGLFGCGSFVLGAAVCCLAVQYTRGEDLLPKIFKLVLGLVFACGTVIVFSDIQPQGMSAFQMTAACYANGVNAWIGGGALGALLGGSCCCCADGLRQPLS